MARRIPVAKTAKVPVRQPVKVVKKPVVVAPKPVARPRTLVKPVRAPVRIVQKVGNTTTYERKNIAPTKIAADIQRQNYQATLAAKQKASGVQFKPAAPISSQPNPYKTVEEAQAAVNLQRGGVNGEGAGTVDPATAAYLEQLQNPGKYASTQDSDAFQASPKAGTPQVTMTGPDGKPLAVNPFATPQDPRNPTGYVAPGAMVGDQRNMDTITPGSAEDLKRKAKARGDARAAGTPLAGGQFDPVTGAYIPEIGKTPEELGQAARLKAQRQGLSPEEAEAAHDAAVQEAMDIEAAEKQAAIDRKATTAANEAAIKEKNANATDTGNVPSAGEAPTMTPEQGTLLAKMQAMGPEGQVLASMFQQSITDQQNQQAEAATLNEDLTNKVDQTFNDVKSQLEQMKTDATSNSEIMNQLLQDIRDDNAAQLAEQQKAADQQLVWSNEKATRGLEKQKTAQHEAMIAQAALGGAFGQDAALLAINDSDNEFEGKIADLQTELGYARTDLAVKFSGLYVQNNNEYRNGILSNFKETQNQLMNINFNGIANTKSKGEAEQTIMTKSFEIRQGIANRYKDKNDGYVKEMMDIMQQEKDTKRAEEKEGWNILNQAIDNYGSLVPKSIIDRVSKMLPPGTDIQDIINTPTFAERNSKRISGAGGTGSNGGAGSFVGSADAVASGIYSDINPQQLSEAVKRVFSPANYGGTASERSDKVNEYLNRISSGESPASIASSLEADFWSSQKGVEKTRHDGRIDAQSSAEALEMAIDYYAITPEDDGVLGNFDSRKESLLSIFGYSSEQYNNLNANVANIRAKIVKENYGAAVTPQELELAKGYIPDMTNKGATFITNVKNLKAYNKYLDAKQFAANAGLPPPKPPIPITLSGNQMSGPGKLSSEDILSALAE